jgi:hypothetical protein
VNDTLSPDAPESFSTTSATSSGSPDFSSRSRRSRIPVGTRSRASTRCQTQRRGEIAHFFTVYKQLENKHVAIEGWYSREDAVREIEARAQPVQQGRLPQLTHSESPARPGCAARGPRADERDSP